MADVFISYTREDRDRARKLAAALETCGWSVWWDRKIIAGQAFDQIIERELELAKCVVVLWSKDSISSEWCKNEAAAAAERGVLVPALIDNVKVPLEFRRKHTADLIGWDGDPSQEGFQALRDGVATVTRIPPAVVNMAPAEPVSRRSWELRWSRRWILSAVAATLAVIGFGLYLMHPLWRKTAESTIGLDYASEMNPVRDQGDEGSSVGFAVAAALEYQIHKAHGQDVIISPRHIYYYARQKGKAPVDKDTGAHLRDAIAVLLDRGAVLEEEWPYRAGEYAAKPPLNLARAEHYRISEAQPVRNVSDLKLALKQLGPVVAGFTIHQSLYEPDASKTGKIRLPSPGEPAIGAHAVCLVGFDDTQRLLKFRNQWGTGWGASGYGYISYEYADKFLIDAWAISDAFVVSEAAGVAVWFGVVTGGVAAVAGSQVDESGVEVLDTESGAFSIRFQRALQDPEADTNRDGQISVAEAATQARMRLKRDGFTQSPTVAGQASKIALFSTTKGKSGSEKYKTVRAVVVGVNDYDQASVELRYAANDAKGFVRLLQTKERALFGASDITTLIDRQATVKAIQDGIEALSRKSGKDDLVVFYFSGHISTVGKGPTAAKAIFPSDFQKGGYLKISDVVESMKKAGAKNALVVVDG